MNDDILRTPDGTPCGFVRRAATGVPREIDTARADISDMEREHFIELANNGEAPEMTEWEDEFCVSIHDKGLKTDKQRKVIDSLIEKYGSRTKGF